ncbi:hypothetical protein [Arcobacter arenosus]|uniref:hypothetical protein n=1 Tax=Arcobacter arenosus TaxID=2576037 RepID=UPI003BAC16B4
MERDYNKDPIVINDKMPNIGFFMFLCSAIFPLIITLLYMKFNNQEIDYTHLSISLSIIYIPSFIFLSSKLAEKKTIKLYEDKIERIWDKNILNFSINENTEVKKGFIDYYDKTQEAPDWVLILYPFIYLFAKFIYQPYLILVKLIYKNFNKLTNKDIYDTIFVFNDDKVISIFIENKENFNELKDYFSKKNIDLSNIKTFKKYDYHFYGVYSTKK